LPPLLTSEGRPLTLSPTDKMEKKAGSHRSGTSVLASSNARNAAEPASAASSAQSFFGGLAIANARWSARPS
jgi:hypothetical protein